ncbi:MAG: hypothetical protein QG632_96 [Candidatus Dependentiae bacterium]|nr:hypothetical protein [Candidatus Dependentiae bacterium]
MNVMLMVLVAGLASVVSAEVRGATAFPVPPSATLPAAATSSTPSLMPIASASPAETVSPASVVDSATSSASPTLLPVLTPSITAGPPASVVHGTATATVSSGSTATPAPATPPAAPATEDKKAEPEDIKVQSIDAAPLFAPSTVQGAVEQKDMYEKSADDESKAQEALTALEKMKSDRLDTYLSFDAELDSVYDASGLTKGDASEQLREAKDHIAADIHSKTVADTSASALIIEQSTLIDKLETEMKALQAKEKFLLDAIKALSDYVLGLGDSVVRISSKRNELNAVLEPAVAASIYKDIQAESQKVVAAQTSIVGNSGQAKAVDDALDVAKKQIAAVKGILDNLSKKQIDLSAIIKKLPPIVESKVEKEVGVDTSAADKNPATPPQDAEDGFDDASDEEIKKKTKKRSITSNSMQSMVQGTVFEVPYDIISAVYGMISDVCAPVTDMLYCFWAGARDWFGHVIGAEDPLKLPDVSTSSTESDPVLERIKHERNQSYEKVQELIAQREIIDMKETLLDRMEAERIMQLDTKERIKEEITRAYERNDRELSWFELFKRFSWKSYAAVRRVISKTTAWWQGKEVRQRRSGAAAGRGIEKKEPETPLDGVLSKNPEHKK